MNVPGLSDSPDFFISYTAADQEWAEWVAWQLEEAGYRVLVQAWDFIPGTNWMAGMQQGIMKAARTIALLSHAYLNSVYGQTEWQAAQAADPLGFARKLIPIRIADCPRPGLLGQIVSFDLFGLSADAATARLTEQIRILHAGRAKPAATPAFPAQSAARPPLPAPEPARPAPPSTPVPAPRHRSGAAYPGPGPESGAQPGPVKNHTLVTEILAARAKARSLERSLREGLETATSSGIVIPRDDVTSRDAEFDEARSVAVDLASDLASVLTLARSGYDSAAWDHAPSLSFAADLAKSIADSLHAFLDGEDLERVVSTVERLSARLTTIPLDVSGADLTRLEAADPRPDDLA
ncbi:TIR domain-containing protein [Frankia sp. Hr75.2]|nr:TIR domain-containing protein [Frankia sp. Hr75.2]